MSLSSQLRKKAKEFLFGKVPGFRGSFPYFGTRVHFPLGSWSFRDVCNQGIFEADNVRLLQKCAVPGTWIFDVGANIGLMAIPILRAVPQIHVVSFEPSPNSIPWLRKTIVGSGYGDRWQLVEKAAGPEQGKVSFFVSPREASLLDGVRDTRRGGSKTKVEIDMTTLDSEWARLGSPRVSVIKIDVEGFEAEVLKGSVELIQQQKPKILLEWNRRNLEAGDICPGALLELAHKLRYRVISVPDLIEVQDEDMLLLQMMKTESYMLIAKAREMVIAKNEDGS
jgi:FkbM family methyltransferase